MPIAPAVNLVTNVDTGNTGSITATFAAGTAGRSRIAWVLSQSGAGGDAAPSSSIGATWTRKALIVGTYHTIAVYLSENISDAAEVLTINLDSSTNQKAAGGCEMDAAAVASFNVAGGQAQASPVSTAADGMSTGNVTPASQPAGVYSIHHNFGNLTAGTNYAQQRNDSGAPNLGPVLSQFQRITSTSPIAATCTTDWTGDAVSALIILKELVLVSSIDVRATNRGVNRGINRGN